MSKCHTEGKNRQVEVDEFHGRNSTSRNCTYSKNCPSPKIGKDEGRNGKKRITKFIYDKSNKPTSVCKQQAYDPSLRAGVCARGLQLAGAAPLDPALSALRASIVEIFMHSTACSYFFYIYSKIILLNFNK